MNLNDLIKFNYQSILCVSIFLQCINAYSVDTENNNNNNNNNKIAKSVKIQAQVLAQEQSVNNLTIQKQKAKEVIKEDLKINPTELLNSSDRSRGAAASTQGLIWNANIKSEEDGETNEVKYLIKALSENAVAQVTFPPRQKGELILFNDRTLWFYKPGIKKPVSLSARQKLMGEAANGDIASTRYARDYNAELVGAELINGQDCWKLLLKAKSKNVTYDKINYWISKKDQLAQRAEFLTLSGELFKSADFKYENTLKIKDQSFPFISEMKIIDSVNKSNITIIQYENPKEEKLPPAIFNVNNLIK